jgi:hypothetical protein
MARTGRRPDDSEAKTQYWTRVGRRLLSSATTAPTSARSPAGQSDLALVYYSFHTR